MKDIRWWAFWRRLQYATGYFFVVAFMITGAYYGYFYSPANCFDGKQNGGELDVDCSGNCTRICAFTVAPPVIVWAESFAITDGQYNAVAYIENSNDIAGVPELSYTFRLYDAAGLITERSGITALPAGSTYPVFEGRINTDGRVPTETTLTLGTIALWLPSNFNRGQFKTSDIALEGADARPRLTASLENSDLEEVQDLEVVATIFDARGTPLTTSQTFIDIFPGRGTVDAVFTWPRPIAKTLRSCDVPTDIVVAVDLSGSMNNDGGTPPQPIYDVLQAASTFVKQLRVTDRVALVTFATESIVNVQLNSDATTTALSVAALAIDPDEERGSTNTGAGLASAFAELNSVRHNPDARSIVVLLTDGLATAPGDDPDAFALAQAKQLKSDDIIVYTIGLGTGVNMSFLREIATEPGFAFVAPNTSTLGTIYRTISSAICEEGAARIDIIPKTDGNFAPYP